jgi:TRAP-type C4-dicarboxylate transport system permease small subunit
MNIKKDDVLPVVVACIVIMIFGTVAYLGYDFYVHIAKRVGYSILKLSIFYWALVFIFVVSAIIGSK